MDSNDGRGQHVVVILDREEGHSRLLSFDDAGCHEVSGADMAGLAGEVGALSPDLILVNPAAVSLDGPAVADELNRILRFGGYHWEKRSES